MKKKTLFLGLVVGALFCFSNASYAQFHNESHSSHSSGGGGGSGDNAFSLSGGLGYNSFLGSGAGSFENIGLNAEYDKESFSYRFSFDYGFPSTRTASNTAESYSSGSSGGPEQINVNETDKFNVMVFALDIKHTFGSSDPGGPGFYIFAGAVYLVESVSSTTFSGSGYNPGLFYVAAPNVSGSQLYLRGGLGYDIKVSDKSLIFGELALNINANLNGNDVSSDLPLYYYFHVGYRYVFGK